MEREPINYFETKWAQRVVKFGWWCHLLGLIAWLLNLILDLI